MIEQKETVNLPEFPHGTYWGSVKDCCAQTGISSDIINGAKLIGGRLAGFVGARIYWDVLSKYILENWDELNSIDKDYWRSRKERADALKKEYAVEMMKTTTYTEDEVRQLIKRIAVKQHGELYDIFDKVIPLKGKGLDESDLRAICIEQFNRYCEIIKKEEI